MAEQGILPPGAKYIWRPYWCSKNTFASEIAAPVEIASLNKTMFICVCVCVCVCACVFVCVCVCMSVYVCVYVVTFQACHVT